jgi:MFS family permease
MLPVYWALIALVVILAAWLIYYYSDPKAALYAKLLVFFSFTTSLLCFAILPIDIYEHTNEESEYGDSLAMSWRVIFYINFGMCWLVLPFGQEYEDSGHFVVWEKVKESLKMNGILIAGLIGGAMVIVLYLVIMQNFSIGQLPEVFATLVNIFGLTLVSIFMGYGLLSFPKECFLRRDYRAYVDRCHRHAEVIR